MEISDITILEQLRNGADSGLESVKNDFISSGKPEHAEIAIDFHRSVAGALNRAISAIENEIRWKQTKDERPPVGVKALGIIEYDSFGRHYAAYGIVSIDKNGKFNPLGRETDVVTWWAELPKMPNGAE